MNVYRALRRGTIFRAMAGREPFVWVQRQPGVQEFGSKYGRWAIDTRGLKKTTVIASFGLGEDVSFEDAVAARFGCRVVGFDPTPRSIQYLKSRKSAATITHLPFALACTDGFIKFYAPPDDAADQVSASSVASYGTCARTSFEVPCRTLPSALAEAGVSSIDVLKLDVEGAEYAVLDSAAERGWLAGVQQILVEFHHFLPGLHADQTREAISLLRNLGFVIAWVGRTNHEYLFLRAELGSRR